MREKIYRENNPLRIFSVQIHEEGRKRRKGIFRGMYDAMKIRGAGSEGEDLNGKGSGRGAGGSEIYQVRSAKLGSGSLLFTSTLVYMNCDHNKVANKERIFFYNYLKCSFIFKKS